MNRFQQWLRVAISLAVIAACISLAFGLVELNRKVKSVEARVESLSDQLESDTRNRFDPQRHARDLMRLMRQMHDKPFVLVIGDSITQRAPLPDEICGFPVVNAGIAGSRVSNFIPFAETMKGFDIKPALIVVALGINDAQTSLRTGFGAAYPLLLDTLPQVPLALATPAPVDFSGADGSLLDPPTVASIEKDIRATAENRRLTLIDLSRVSTIRGYMTGDGVHLSVNGYVLWNAAMLDGIKRALKC